MLERFSETELLAFIEDELAPEAGESIRAALAREPRIAAAVDGMRRDRTLLRATPEPEVPPQVLAGLEQWMAKPMLIDAPGTRWRAQRSRARHVRWALTGLAAGLGLAGFATLWVVVSDRQTNRPIDEIAANTNDETGAGESMVARAVAGGTKSGGDLPHSSATPPDDGDSSPPSAPAGAFPARAGHRAAAASPIAATFALVLAADDPALAVDHLRAWSSDRAAESALVRNLTYDEAARLARDLPRRPAGDEPALAGELPTSSTGPGFKLDDDFIALLARRPKHEAADESSGLIGGRRELGASYEQQLAFSQSGAEMTLTIPLAHLQDVLVELHRAGGFASLRLLPEPTRPGEAAPDLPDANTESAWLGDWPAISAEVRRLEREHPEAVVLLPVVIRPADASRAPRR